MKGMLFKRGDKWVVLLPRNDSDTNNVDEYPVHPDTSNYGVGWYNGGTVLFELWREGEKNPGDKIYHTVHYAKLLGTDISGKNELHDADFVNWLLRNCTTKTFIGNTAVYYYWTLNKDYKNSWDGDDVPLYTTESIFEYYNKNK